VAVPHSYAYGRSQKCLSHHSLYESLRLTASRLPNQLSIVSQHEQLERTFDQLHQDVLRLAHGLRTRCDVQAQQIVVVWSANSYLFVVAQYAIARLGAILCPLNAYYKVGELAHAVTKVRPTVLIMPGIVTREYKLLHPFALPSFLLTPLLSLHPKVADRRKKAM
jgi:fatty-acyl-CoA synthase